MHHEMLTQRTFFAITHNTKGMLSQHFVTHVVPPLAWLCVVYSRPPPIAKSHGQTTIFAFTNG